MPNRKASGFKRCPKCGLVFGIRTGFGWRQVDGKWYTQGACRSCQVQLTTQFSRPVLQDMPVYVRRKFSNSTRARAAKRLREAHKSEYERLLEEEEAKELKAMGLVTDTTCVLGHPNCVNPGCERIYARRSFRLGDSS